MFNDSVRGISRALRNIERPGNRKRFFTVCMSMVEAPRAGPPSWTLAATVRKARQSTPEWRQKRASSEAITACVSQGDIFSSGTATRSTFCPVNQRASIKVETGFANVSKTISPARTAKSPRATKRSPIHARVHAFRDAARGLSSCGSASSEVMYRQALTQTDASGKRDGRKLLDGGSAA